jgi:16S rRNA (cytidine1402-2'-O)-methyltransferase
MSATLWVVGTPIGNLEDLTDRARATLGRVTLVAAEDTRRTGLLLHRLDVSVPMVSVFEASEVARIPRVLEALARGEDVALVSDGGMPLVSDPGYRLVGAAIEAGFAVRVVPGPSAAIAALTVSGLPTDRWVFEGFLPRKAGDRARRLEALRTEPRTIVLFESPKRVVTLLRQIERTMGDRPVALCRELTKLHEETLRGQVSHVAEAIGEGPVRGEVALVIAGAPGSEPDLEAATVAARLAVEGGAKPREAARQAAGIYGVAANAIYQALTETGPA